MTKFKKGDTVYVHSYDERNKSFNGTILSAGSKYIKIQELPGLLFDPHTLRSDYMQYTLYTSEEEYRNETFRIAKFKAVQDKLYRTQLTIEDLLAIEQILDNAK